MTVEPQQQTKTMMFWQMPGASWTSTNSRIAFEMDVFSSLHLENWTLDYCCLLICNMFTLIG